jgi:hypothetical protein
MIDPKAQLIVKHEVSGAFTDYSHKTNNFGKDSFTISLASADRLYVGFRKPINAIYFNHNSIYDEEGLLSLEFYNGITWANVEGLGDDTLGFKRSGFVHFDRNQTGHVPHLVDDYKLYWYRFSSSEPREDLVLSGINLVFADDYDLMMEQPYITMQDFLGTQKSHILIHAACRNEIIQKLKNKDFIKYDSDGVKQDLNQWDLLEIGEVKQGAIFLAMSKIYFNMSDSLDDVWGRKSTEYFKKFVSMIDLAALSLDLNDDGKAESAENKVSFSVRYMSR